MDENQGVRVFSAELDGVNPDKAPWKDFLAEIKSLTMLLDIPSDVKITVEVTVEKDNGCR